MKKEYRVEMFRKGKWIKGHSPNNVNARIFTDYMDAVNFHDRIITAWGEYENKVKTHFPADYDPESFPHKFRIVRREVTEWESIS